MIAINLLPWREIQFIEAKRRLLMHLIYSAILALMVGISLHFMYGWWIDLQRQSYQDLNKKIEPLAQTGKQVADLIAIKEQLIEHITWVHTVADKRAQIVSLFDALIRAIPDGLYFTEIIREANNVVIAGKAENNAQVSQLLRNIEKTDIFREVSLNNIKTEGRNVGFDQYKNSFSLQAIYEE